MLALNPALKGLDRSATLAINEKVTALRANGKKIYSFGLGQSPFPVPQCVVESLKAHAHEKDYLDVQGLLTLREAVAQFHVNNGSPAFGPHNILIGPGSKELMFIAQLCFDGDVLLPTPCWVSYEPQARIINQKFHRLPTTLENDWQLKPVLLESFCSQQRDPYAPKLMILNYPSNPCGTNYDIKNLKAIVNVARTYNITILSDEIYSLIQHTDSHVSIAKYYPEGTIISSGLSKWCGAGGWRLGTFAFPDELQWLLEAMCVVASETYTSVSAPIQHASIAAFQQSDEIKEYLRHSRLILKTLGDWIVTTLRQSNVMLSDTHGGFYIFPDFSHFRQKFSERGITSSIKLSEVLLEQTGVATLPGTSFGLDLGDLKLRMSYVDFDGAKALEASRVKSGNLDHSFLFEYCPNAVEGIQKVIQWLNM